MTNHLALWGFAEFAFCLTRMNPEMIYLHQDSGFLNISYYKFDTDDVTGTPEVSSFCRQLCLIADVAA